jgi:hypothetical protein
MPKEWMNQSTLGDIERVVQEKTLTSSTRQETRINTRLSLVKQKSSVLVKVEKTTVQSELSVYGTQSQEMNRTEYGEAFLIVRGTP